MESKFRDIMIEKKTKVYLQHQFVTKTWSKKKAPFKIPKGRQKRIILQEVDSMTRETYVKKNDFL